MGVEPPAVTAYAPIGSVAGRFTITEPFVTCAGDSIVLAQPAAAATSLAACLYVWLFVFSFAGGVTGVTVTVQGEGHAPALPSTSVSPGPAVLAQNSVGGPVTAHQPPGISRSKSRRGGSIASVAEVVRYRMR